MAVHPWLSPALSMTQFKEETMLVHPVVIPGSGTRSWTVLGDDDVPVVPVDRFLAYLTDIGRSPNTVRAYAHDLKDYWVFIGFRGLDWREGRLEAVPAPCQQGQAVSRAGYLPEGPGEAAPGPHCGGDAGDPGCLHAAAGPVFLRPAARDRVPGRRSARPAA